MMCKTTRLEIDRGWISFGYIFLFLYSLFMTLMPFFILNKTDLMWVFMFLGPFAAAVAFYLFLCARHDSVMKERLVLPVFASFLVILGVFRVINIMLAQGDYVESMTNAFLYVSMAGVLLYRANTLDKIMRDQKEIKKMEQENK